ncbi:MAG TPA: monovalent cation/H+ antiporter complex subunit F [Egibacteraceae bacterium]|nr:monovalent cation/H+ antiporter complex subunit F [Egibacteraceae bacterium]
MDAVITTALAGLIAGAALCLARLLRPGSLADRIVALDTMLTIIVSGVAVGSLLTTDAFLDLLVVVSLLGFVGTITVARFMERRGP